MGATNVEGERAPPATDVNHKDDLEKQDTDPLKPAGKRRKGKGTGSKAAKSSKTSGIVVVSLIVFFGLFALITWLALRPVHRPKYNIDSIQIKAFAMNATDSTLDANFAYNVTAYNENHKMDFKYDWITIDASYSGQNIGRGSVAGFKLGKTSSTSMTTEMNVENVTLPEEWATSLTAAIRNESVPLRVYAKAKLHVQIGKYVSFPLSLDLDCSLVVAPPSPTAPGKVVTKECRLTRPPYKKPKKFKTFKH